MLDKSLKPLKILEATLIRPFVDVCTETAQMRAGSIPYVQTSAKALIAFSSLLGSALILLIFTAFFWTQCGEKRNQLVACAEPGKAFDYWVDYWPSALLIHDLFFVYYMVVGLFFSTVMLVRKAGQTEGM